MAARDEPLVPRIDPRYACFRLRVGTFEDPSLGRLCRRMDPAAPKSH
jgi:hypothetical protein